MKGMEKERYLKPYFSKYFKPLINFLLENADIYQIPDEIKDRKDGIFMFPKTAIPNSVTKFTSFNTTNAVGTPSNAVLEIARKKLQSAHKNRPTIANAANLGNINPNNIKYRILWKTSS